MNKSSALITRFEPKGKCSLEQRVGKIYGILEISYAFLVL